MKTNKLLPILTIPTVCATAIIPMVSCGAKYDINVDLHELVTKDYVRTTEYIEREPLAEIKASAYYTSIIKQNYRFLTDDIFEAISTAHVWEDGTGNLLQGKVGITIDNIGDQKFSISGGGNVNFNVADEQISIQQLSFSGDAKIVNIPFNVIYKGTDDLGQRWELRIDTTNIETLDDWSVTINGRCGATVEGTEYSTETINFTWNKDTLNIPIIGEFVIKPILDGIRLNLPSLKKVQKL